MISKTTEYFDIELLKHYLLVALGTIVLWRIFPAGGAVVVAYFVIVSAVRQKPTELMFWVLFLAFTLVGNRQLMPTTNVTMVVLRATLLLLTILLAKKLTSGGGANKWLLTPFWGLMFYLAWEALVSAQGFSPIISYLKLFLFVTMFLGLLGTANAFNHSLQADGTQLRTVILAIVSIVIIGSVLLMPFPALSQLRSEEALQAMLRGEVVGLFQGITAHSQAMGTLSAILGTLLFADLVFSIRKWDRFYLLLLLLCPCLIYKTSSRTAMGTLIAGVGMVVFFIMQGKGLNANWKGKLLMVINMLVVAGTISVCALPNIRRTTARFVLKAGEQSTASEIKVENVLLSRQELIDTAVMNFKNKPLLGNGFQVSSDMQTRVFRGLSSYLSAPIEKGIWIYAVPEEGGIIGMALFCGWLLILFKLLIARQAYIGASVFFAVLVSNLGEFTLFAMSYAGGFNWALTFAALCLDCQRLKMPPSAAVN